MVVGALSAAAVFDVGSATAEAAPSVSRFAGTYVGRDPLRWSSNYGYLWIVTISDGGRITGSYSGGGHSKGSISGRVGDDGRYSFTVSVTTPSIAGWGQKWVTSRYDSVGNLTPDVDGNIVGTPDVGESFLWVRQ
jgi:hypothetical protein